MPDEIRCHFRPSDSIRRAFSILHPAGPGVPLLQALEGVLATDALAKLLGEAMLKARTTDGRIDMRDVAYAVMVRMGQLQEKGEHDLHGRIDDTVKVDALARLLTEAVDLRTRPGTGDLDLRDVAAHVLAQMRRSQR